MSPLEGPFCLEGQVAVVVGGTGVLGGAMAKGLAAAGAKVAVVGRSVERGDRVVEAILAAGGQGLFVAADACLRQQLELAHSTIADAIGAPDILVNAAGGNDPRVTVTEELAFEEIELSAWNDSFELNLAAGVLLPCQIFGPPMVAAGAGSIINIA